MQMEPTAQLQCTNTRAEQVNKMRHKRQNDANMRPRRTIGKFFLSTTLGKGSMGKVKLALNTETNERMAVKIVPRKLMLNKTKKERKAEVSREIRTIREASIMLLLDHPFIAKLHEMVLIDDFYYLFMEYVDGGQLLDYVISHARLKEEQAREFARQIASALDYCHCNSIVHRDLKVENILISRSGTVKIIDFGLSNVFSPKSHLSTFCGSLYFAAPELLDGRVYTGPEVDVWSFGVVLYVLVTGQVPFDDSVLSALQAKIKQGIVEYPVYLSSDCKNLLQRMLVTNRKQRASMSEVIAHPWLNKGYDAPVESFLPKRKPLQLPIDMNVVRGMTGFEFGSEEEIRIELEAIITSKEYQTSTKQLERLCEKPSSGYFLKQRSSAHTTNNHLPISVAYHPLISIYYLVQERMQRDALFRKQNDQYGQLNNFDSIQDEIGISYTVHGKMHIHNQTIQKDNQAPVVVPDSSTGSCGSGHNRRCSISNESATSKLSGSTTTSSNGAKHNIIKRLTRRLSRQQQTEKTNESAANTRQARYDADNVPIIITKQRATADTPIVALDRSSVIVEYHPPTSCIQERHITESIGFGKRFNKIIKRATSIAAKDLPSTHHGTGYETTTESSARRRSVYVTTAERSLLGLEEVKVKHSHQKEHFNALLATPINETALLDKQDESIQRRKQRADDYVKSVYLKGLFSVATTSNKKPSAIRQEIIRVLKGKSISYCEEKDRFECFLKSILHINNAKKMNNVTDDDTSSKDSIDVRFDIYIVKIPLLYGMRGVRFRRVSGDSWHYKNTCRMILDSLNL